MSLEGQHYLEVFNTLWICEQAETNKADSTLVQTPKTLTHCPSLFKRRQSGTSHPFGTTLNNLANVKSVKYQKLLLNELEGTRAKL